MHSAGIQSTVRNNTYFLSDAMFHKMLLCVFQLTDASPEPGLETKGVSVSKNVPVAAKTQREQKESLRVEFQRQLPDVFILL